MRFTLFLVSLLLIGVYTLTVETPSPQEDGVDVDARIKKLYGKNVIEYNMGKKDRISSCGKNGSPDGSQCYWFFLDPQDGDRDPEHNKHGYTDRARIEIRFSEELSSATEGETWNHRWYFWVKPDAIITNNFFHIHQIKSEPANEAANNPIITFTLQHNKLKVDHWDSQKVTTTLAEIPAKNALGKWLYADQTIRAGSEGSYKLTLKDAATGKVLVKIPERTLDMWRGGRSIHPKMGIYRKHGAWERVFLAFSEWKFKQVK